MSHIFNGIELPACAIGTWGWGEGINGSNMIFGTKSLKDELLKTYKAAVAQGLTLFDTAAVYGLGTSETLLGEFIKNSDSILISTKYTPEKSEKTDRIEKSLNESLARLEKKYVDVLWLHAPVNIEKNITKMIEFIKQGKVKNIGVSNCNLAEIQLAEDILQKSGYHLFGVQNHYSLLYRQSEQTGILDWCKKNDTAFFAYMVLEQGALTGVKKFPMLSRRGIAFPKSRLNKLEPLNKLINELSEKYSVKPSQIVIAHSLVKGMLPIIGVTKTYQADQLAKAINITLNFDEIEALEQAAADTGVTVKASWEKRMI